MTSENGFQCTGIFPFNRKAIQRPTVTDRISSLAQETGLNFMPLYTCRPLGCRSSSNAGETTNSAKDDSPHACLQWHNKSSLFLHELCVLSNASPLRPLLLILDGHSTHYQPSIIRLAASEQVILFCLPPPQSPNL